ncbi:MAG: hypothetical protein UU10_C0043G0002 [Parcubacteria group bacterium GW2011_GWF1_40_6]|nr:MAG: hypothetical protein UU10_C0043G0002 [Parcubacteria group bacterium GW2011_GWF1_40_6]
MRNLISTLALTMALVTIILSTPALGAENVATFDSQMEADATFHSGYYAKYTPFTQAKNPVRGEKRKTETAILAELFTHPHGWRWVIYFPGDELTWKGSTPIGDPRCGNPIRAWAYPTPPTPAPVTTKELAGLPPTTNIVGSFNTTTTVVVNPDPGKGTAPEGSWYTKWWKKSPTTAVLAHVAVIVGTGLALKGGGGHKTNGIGNTIE